MFAVNQLWLYDTYAEKRLAAAAEMDIVASADELGAVRRICVEHVMVSKPLDSPLEDVVKWLPGVIRTRPGVLSPIAVVTHDPDMGYGDRPRSRNVPVATLTLKLREAIVYHLERKTLLWRGQDLRAVLEQGAPVQRDGDVGVIYAIVS